MNHYNNTFQKNNSSPSKSDIIIDKEHNIKYRKGEKLGEGGFGEVYEFIIIGTNEKRAAKIINNSKLDDPQSQNAYYNEKKYNELLGFKYLCKCHYIFSDEKYTYFILDYMKNKTLKELNEKRKLSELEIKHYCFELLLALEYLHKMNIIHRDIKLSNVLLNENMEVKLCDFGLAIDNNLKEQKNICGTMNYIAPELYNKKGGGLKYSFKTDIWAFGILMYTLFYHSPPFKAEPKKKIEFNMNNIEETLHKDSSISKEAKDLLKKILVKDPDSRPKIETIKASSFFNSGKGIPKFLPESTTKKSLTRDEEEEYVNNAIIKGECLDKDFDLPDRTANKRYSYTSYTERNEMESNIDHEELSMRDEEYDDYDKNDNIMNSNNYNNNVFMNTKYNKNNIKENEMAIELKIDKNKPGNSISFSNNIFEKNVSREETKKMINAQNESIDTKKISDNNSIDTFPAIIKSKEKGIIKTSKFKKKENNNKEIEEKNDKENKEIKIYNKQINKVKFVIDKNKNNFNENEEKKQILKENINNNNIYVENNGNDNNIIINNVNNNSNILIKKYIDLSDKCGIGYLLTNDDIGVYFNDGTKMIRIKHTTNIIYIDEKGNEENLSLRKTKINQELKTKINVLILFNKKFIKNSEKKNFEKNINKQTVDLFVKKWIKSQYAYFFLLSNNKIQIIFEDKSQIIFDFKQKNICYINKMKENIVQNIDNNKFKNKEMEKKVNHAKKILIKI